MAQPKIAAWGFAVAGILFRGGRLNAVFLPLGLIFLVLSVIFGKKNAPTSGA